MPSDSDGSAPVGNGAVNDHRRSPRRRVLKLAKIVYNGGHSVLDARLQDISETGARIRLDSPVMLPDDFDLHLADGRKLRVEVVWRNAALLGVRFVNCPRSSPAIGNVEAGALLDRVLDIERQLAELRRDLIAHLHR